MSKMGDKLIEIEERDLKPSLREPIYCDCHEKVCRTYVRVEVTGAMVSLFVAPTQLGEMHVLLDQNHALDLAMVLQEAVSDARAEGGS